MGEAKRRRAEIEKLKRSTPHDDEARRRAGADEDVVDRGIDPSSIDPTPTAAMARSLFRKFEEAKRVENVDEPIKYLRSKVDGTVYGLRDVPIACRKGCSHCCHIWVSATAPEVLFLSKIIKRRGQNAIDRVRAAHETSQHYDLDARADHPQPCPLLNGDSCSVYPDRPIACRLAASGNIDPKVVEMISHADRLAALRASVHHALNHLLSSKI